MKFELIISSKAEDDARDALCYYDEIDTELGTRFLDELAATYKKIAANPQYCSFITSTKRSKLRDIKLRSFPYVVIFEIIGDTVYVVALMSTYKKPFVS